MCIEGYEGRTVLRGHWLYSGEVRMVVEVVAFDRDYWFHLPGDNGRAVDEPYPLNAEGVLYYVRADGGDAVGFPPFQTVEAARAWADAQPWAPIAWDEDMGALAGG